MIRVKRRVHQVARLAKRPTSDVLAAIRSLGLDVRSENDLIPADRIDQVDRLLAINRWAVAPLPPRKRLPAETETKVSSEMLVVSPDLLPVQPKPRLPRWPTVGQPTDQIIYITADEVEKIHWILVQDFRRAKDPIDPPGVKSRDLLESAVHRMKTSLGNQTKYPTVAMAAAALLHAVISNHAFHNGNKRTALVATLAFLDINGFVLEANENELFDYLLRIAAHEVESGDNGSDGEMLEVARWLHRHARPISNEEKVIKFHDLRSILRKYGCRFESPNRGNRVNIRRGARSTQVYYRNEGTDVERNTIRQIRKDLGLTDEEGYDSAIFYKAEERVPSFIHKYRRTLDRLAKV